MKGIAPLIFVVIMAIAAAGGIGLSLVGKGSGDAESPRTNSTGNVSELVDIGSTAVWSIPFRDIWDMAYSGCFGVARFLVNKIFMPLADWAASWAAGHTVHLHPVVGYAALIFMALMLFITNWHRATEFILHKTIWLVALVIAIFFIGIFMGYLGMI